MSAPVREQFSAICLRVWRARDNLSAYRAFYSSSYNDSPELPSPAPQLSVSKTPVGSELPGEGQPRADLLGEVMGLREIAQVGALCLQPRAALTGVTPAELGIPAGPDFPRAQRSS